MVTGLTEIGWGKIIKNVEMSGIVKVVLMTQDWRKIEREGEEDNTEATWRKL